MRENYKPSDELLNSYGEDPNQIEGVSIEYREPIETEEAAIEEIYNPIFLAEEYLKEYSDEERIKMDSIAEKQGDIVECLNSINLIEREHAEYAVLGSIFASAPTNEYEIETLPAWKRVLGGASMGAKVATLAVAMMIPVLAQSKEKKEVKPKDRGDVVAPISPEERAVQKMGDNIFGKDFLGIKEDRKEWYMEMEKEKRNLLRQLENEPEMAPRSEEEKSMFKVIEAKRDRQLAEIKIQEIKLSKESMKADLSDPEVVAVIEARTLKIEEAKARVIHDFESEIKRAYNGRGKSEKQKMIRSRIDEIERDQKRLINHEIRKTNGYHYSGWSY
jgi:hypothetical protein